MPGDAGNILYVPQFAKKHAPKEHNRLQSMEFRGFRANVSPPSGICMCINIYIHTYVAKEASHIILKKKQTMFHPGLLHQLLTVCHLAAGRYL